MGLSVSIPIGPVNIEITRKNLNYGLLSGVLLGFGATIADITYLILFASGAITFLQHSSVLRFIGVLGSLFIFSIGAIALFSTNNLCYKKKSVRPITKKYLIASIFEGYFLAIFNPGLILFWFFIGSVAIKSPNPLITMFDIGCGIILANLSWTIFFNLFLSKAKAFFCREIIYLDKCCRWIINDRVFYLWICKIYVSLAN